MLEGVVALGGNNLTEAQLEDALRYKVKSFVLALDNDQGGQIVSLTNPGRRSGDCQEDREWTAGGVAA